MENANKVNLNGIAGIAGPVGPDGQVGPDGIKSLEVEIAWVENLIKKYYNEKIKES